MQRENERQAAMAGLMTTLPQPGVEKHLEISAWILSGNSHADQPAERRLEGGNHFWNRAGIADIGDKKMAVVS